MMTEERERFQVLLEDIQTNMRVLAEAQGAAVERFDRMDTRFDTLETRFDRLEIRFDVLATKVDGLETKVDGLEVFASDAQRRLKRIEGHLELNGSSRSSPRQKATRTAPPKRRKKP